MKIEMAIQLETHNSGEDMVTTAARLSEVLGNLPPLSSISCRCSPLGVTTFSAAQPSSYSNTSSSRDRTKASPAPMAKVPTANGYSTEKVEVRKRSLSRRRSILEQGGRNSIHPTVEASYEVRPPVVKRRRIPVRVRSSTRAASVVPTGR